MSATSSKRSRKSLSPQTIQARVFVTIFLIAIFCAIFVLPWVVR